MTEEQRLTQTIEQAPEHLCAMLMLSESYKMYVKHLKNGGHSGLSREFPQASELLWDDTVRSS